MPRLYLIFILLIGQPLYGQNYLRKYLDFAKEQYDKGDYFYALTYYNKAMELDSNTIDILWNYAETLRAYKDYRKAEYYYAKVYDREAGQIYPYSLLYLGLMQKQNGNYDTALETFKKAKKKYYKDKKSYLYIKSKREIESVLWAQSALRDTADVSVGQLPTSINSKNSEFGHGIYDGYLYFSSLRADSISEQEEVYEKTYKTKLYRSKWGDSLSVPELLKELSDSTFSTGNGTFSLDKQRFYFSRCDEIGNQYKCRIMVAYISNGKWTHIDELGELINESNANTTMPCIAAIEGREHLIFASDKEDGEGGLDLYLSEIKNGNQFGKVKPIKSANSPDNEVTPWWDAEKKRLYFASSWHNGFGGLDVMYIPYLSGQFTSPENAGLPLNSPANDLYFFNQADTFYVTSNRIGVNYSKNPTCCSDVFEFKPPVIIIPPTPEETLEDLNKRLPVTLYFHNDVPNPKSWEKTTTVNYIKAYDEYTAMLEKYKEEYAKGLNGERADEAKEDIETFFIEYVDKGVADLQLFRDLLLKELDKGAKIKITVKGFASPLAKTNYNVHLTKRRIHSLINYLREYNGGVFAKYLDNTAENGGRVLFEEVPFGEYTANQLTSDNPNDVQNSVYSRNAAIERKIEIQSVSYFTSNEKFPLSSDSTVYDAGYIKKGQLVQATFEVKNTSNQIVKIDTLRIPNGVLSASLSNNEISPGGSIQVKLTLDSTTLSGFQVQSVYIRPEGFDEELRLYITAQVTD